ncbi:hypothetical protein B0T26DRAFT_850151 [Lasiosphaeria miniovina]|uniref:RBR-type E3 ubiquitin transferase n=1 Tax=Lasiosphaeria miniovina TaxID=1954250 RepID=A0AA40AU02_9PEZI|nr:uncharacterized protein B0T26DRAFT_850151 [Lasiosphaeria miniovina]KAK0721917.1 hypothetical protein B0T26DRAFT_850151 [Lasiosphaeria miniovina]
MRTTGFWALTYSADGEEQPVNSDRELAPPPLGWYNARARPERGRAQGMPPPPPPGPSLPVLSTHTYLRDQEPGPLRPDHILDPFRYLVRNAPDDRRDAALRRFRPPPLGRLEDAATAKCTTCGDELFLIVSCGCKYCGDCLRSMFRVACSREALFPPKCCDTAIPVIEAIMHEVLGCDLVNRFMQRSREWAIPADQRRYCSDPKCSNVLNTADALNAPDGSSTATCHSCGTRTCVRCLGAAHLDQLVCPIDKKTEQVKGLMQRNAWKQCSKCGQAVERANGCRHMICLCGHEFCYRCEGPWEVCAVTPRCVKCPDYGDRTYSPDIFAN